MIIEKLSKKGRFVHRSAMKSSAESVVSTPVSYLSHKYVGIGDCCRPDRRLDVNNGRNHYSLPLSHPSRSILAHDFRWMSPRSALLLPLILLSLSPTLCCVSHCRSALALAPNPFHSTLIFSLPHSRPVDVLSPTLCLLSAAVDIQPAMLMAKSSKWILAS